MRAPRNIPQRERIHTNSSRARLDHAVQCPTTLALWRGRIFSLTPMSDGGHVLHRLPEREAEPLHDVCVLPEADQSLPRWEREAEGAAAWSPSHELSASALTIHHAPTLSPRTIFSLLLPSPEWHQGDSYQHIHIYTEEIESTHLWFLLPARDLRCCPQRRRSIPSAGAHPCCPYGTQCGRRAAQDGGRSCGRRAAQEGPLPRSVLTIHRGARYTFELQPIPSPTPRGNPAGPLSMVRSATPRTHGRRSHAALVE